MLPVLVTKNWNGTLMNDAWRIVKPESPNYYVGASFDIREYQRDGVLLGTAIIVAISRIHFRDINDNISFHIIGRNAMYFKTVLDKMYGFTDSAIVHVLTLSWTSRVIDAHKAIFEVHWDNILKKAKQPTLFNQPQIPLA